MTKNNRPTILSLKIVNNLFINKKGITIKDLSRNLNTDYKNIHDSISILFKQGIIIKEKIGNYNICKLNYSNEDIVEYLKEYNYLKLKEFRKKYPTEYRIITETLKQLETSFFICLVFGSYAKDKIKKTSDIDLLFLTSSSINAKKTLNKINTPYQKKFHVIEQNIEDFKRDLTNKTVSIATEINKESAVVFYGDDIFFRVMINAE